MFYCLTFENVGYILVIPIRVNHYHEFCKGSAENHVDLFISQGVQKCARNVNNGHIAFFVSFHGGCNHNAFV